MLVILTLGILPAHSMLGVWMYQMDMFSVICLLELSTTGIYVGTWRRQWGACSYFADDTELGVPVQMLEGRATVDGWASRSFMKFSKDIYQVTLPWNSTGLMILSFM